MRKQIKNNQKCVSIFLSILLLSMFTIVAFAEEPVDDTASAGAQAIAIGDETETTAQAVVNDDGASSSATSRAKAENGGTATAIAEAWANWYDGSSAYARAMAVAVAGMGETIWAEATAQASVSSDGTTTAYAGACVGDAGCIDPSTDGSGNAKQKIKVETQGRDFFGFAFGKSDPGRYYYFKKVANGDITTTISLSDENNTYMRDRAKDYMWSIAWDRGLNQTQFENKYKESNYTVEVEEIVSKEGLKLVLK